MREEEHLLGVNRVERGASLLDEIAAELAVEEDSASGGRGGEETPLKVKLQRMLQEEEGSNKSPSAAYLSPSDDRRKGAVFAQDLGSLFASGFGLLGDGGNTCMRVLAMQTGARTNVMHPYSCYFQGNWRLCSFDGICASKQQLARRTS